MNITELKEKIVTANESYRNGKPTITDREYDALVEELTLLSPHDELLSRIGIEIPDTDSRKSKLPIEMASMNKLKTMDEVFNWARLKGINDNTKVVITPKFDGLSFCVDEFYTNSWTRGDGTYGQKSNEHYKLIKNHLYDVEGVDPFSKIDVRYTYGEVMMSKKVFLDKYSEDFANPRNLVGGLLNSKEASKSLSDCNYIKYGAVSDKKLFDTKSELLDYLNDNQEVKVPYKVCKVSELTEDLLLSLFKQYSTDYEIDGLIIEINDLELQEKLGRETSTNNPAWARAFKHESFEQSAIVPYIGTTWNISKQGLLKPIIHITPVKLDGVMVSNVTGNNARFMKDLEIGEGAILKIVRSGMVIPKIVDVIRKGKFVEPTIEGVEIGWNENGVELITLTETEEQKFQKIVSFFEILEADNVGEGVLKQIWDNGFKTIKDILNLTTSDLEKLEGFGKRKSTIVFNSIQKSISNVELSKLQHATGIFKGLGSKKLALLEHFTNKPTVSEVMNIEGFAEISAKSYVDSYDDFFEFIKDLPVKLVEKKEVVKTGSDLEDMSFCFTGVRDKSAEETIVSRGGKIASGVSKNTTHLVMKSKGSGSSKETKALELGVTIITLDELKQMLG